MADLAPGQEVARSGASCFNCGSQAHFAYACPEPIRAEPAGLVAIQQRKNADHNRSSNRGNNNKLKGPVITKYNSPAQSTPTPGYWAAAPPPPPPPVPNGTAIPPASYPTYNNPVPQTAPVHSNGWPVPQQAYPPMPYATPNQYPQQGPYGGHQASPPQYNQYGQSAYVQQYNPGGGYGPGYPHGNTGYPQPQGYPPQAGYAPPPFPVSYPQPTAITPAAQAPYLAYGHYPQPGPPPPPGNLYPPPGLTAPYQGPPNLRHADSQSSQQEMQWLQERGRDRQRRDSRPEQSDAGRSKSGAHTRDASTVSSVHRSASIKSAQREVLPQSQGEPRQQQEQDRDLISGDGDFEWELKAAFLTQSGKPADSVGRPLPWMWNDDPTIPPACNATHVKSDYFDGDDENKFGQSVQSTKHWTVLKDDPLFQFREGMSVVQFDGGEDEYFTYHTSRKLEDKTREERHVQDKPKDSSMVDCRKPAASRYTQELIAPKLSRGASLPESSHKRAREEADHGSDRFAVKRHTSYSQADRPYRDHRPSDSYIRDHRWEQRRDFSPPRREYRSRDGYRSPLRRPDSRYRDATHSPPPRRRSFDRDDGWFRERPRDVSPPPPAFHDKGRPLGSPPNIRRTPPSIRKRDNHQKLSPSILPPSSKASPPPPAPVPPTPHRRMSNASDASSQMSDLEYELLGLSRPQKEVKNTSPPKPTPKRRPIKVNDAFSRRW